MSTRQDVLELLLPKAAPPVLALARRVTTFARLLCDDAPGPEAERVAVSLERARMELDRDSRERLLSALEELMRLHLDAALGPESFLSSGEPGDAARAWSLLEEARDELPELPAVPQPGERDVDVARRLLHAAQRLAAQASARPWSVERIGAWSARLERAAAGPGAGARAFREQLGACPAGARGRRALLAGLAGCLLDCGHVRETSALLEADPARLSDSTLRRLHGWCRLLLGDSAGAREAQGRTPSWRGLLPAALVELREERPEWLPLLAGRSAPAAAAESPPLVAAPLSRADLGAVLVAVFRLDGPRALHLLHADAAPGVRAQLEPWRESREGALSNPLEYEHQLVVSARPVRIHRQEVPLRGSIVPARVLAVALHPLLHADGEVGGWLRVECEHHLLPARSKLEALASHWRPHIARASEALAVVAPARAVRGSRTAEVFGALVRELGMKTAQRHWWGFEVHARRVLLAAEGGLPLPADVPGGGKALDRALLTGGSVRFEEPASALAQHAPSASGIVLPLSSGASTCGLLAVESLRRRDLPEGLERRVGERWGRELRLAQWSDWHRARFGNALHFSSASAAGAQLVDDIMVAARARAPVALWGPGGSGKRSVARCMHFEAGGDGPLLERSCSAARTGASIELAAALREAQGGTLVLRDLDMAAPAFLQELLDWLHPCDGGAEGDTRLVLTSALSPHSSPQHDAPVDAPSGQAEVATPMGRVGERLGRLLLRVPPLEERREELPALVPLLLARFAEEQGRPVPVLEDDALALLWRQPWSGNVRELANLLFKLALFAPGAQLGAEPVRRLASRFQIVLRERLPSRHPRPLWVRAALRTTCTQKRTLNKTRAALYLGWDPDTLSARMRDLAIPDSAQALEAEPGEALPWTAPEAPGNESGTGSLDPIARPAGE